MSSQADYIFYGGDIITMDEKNPCAEALAVKGDIIQAVGKLEEVFALAGPSTQVIYLNQQTLLPGFIEPHQHATMVAMCRKMYVNISGYYYASYDAIKELMNTEIATLDPGAIPLPWAMFFGWDPELIPNMPTLSADFLDGFSTTFPVAVVGQSGHVAWVNHKAFEVAGVDDSIEDENGGVFVKDEDGHLTGQLFEEPAITRVLGRAPPLTISEMKIAVEEQWKDYASRGFTTVTDLAYMGNKALDSMLQDISAGSTGMDDGITFTPNENLWEAGVKIISDGSPHCGTAAVREPFLNSNLTQTLGFPPAPCYGQLNYSSEELLETVKFFHQQGTQIAVHAHGERAIDQVISVYEQVLNEFKEPKDMRHRIEHLGLCTIDDIERAAKINLGLSFFVCHLYFYARAYTEHIFGAERTNRWTPLSAATKNGICWTIHQDHATFPGPPLPFANIKTAVTRTQRDDKETVYGPEYCVSIHEAMKAVTINVAWQIHRDNILGSLTKNKKADLLILSENPYKVDPFDLESITVLETFMNGRPTGLNKTCLMDFAGGSFLMYAAESNTNGADAVSLKRKGRSPFIQQ